MLDIQVRAYNQQWGTKYKILIPTNIFGPNDNFNLTEGHAVAAIIHRMYLAKKNNESFKVWGTGKALREFVYADDIAKIALDTVLMGELECPVIISNATETSIKQLVGVVAEAMDFRNPISFDPSQPEGQLRKPSSDSKFRELWPQFTFTSLEAGIAKSVQWFETNYPNVRR
jgi:GDP-L-fucose synthase